LVILILVSGTSASLAAEMPPNRFGFFVGLNVANMGGDMDALADELSVQFESELGGTWSTSRGSTTGLGAGVSYLVALSPTLGIQIEGQYVRRGAKLESSGRGVTFPDVPSELDVTTKFKVDYLELPLLLRASPGPGGKFRPVFFAGPVVGLRVGADLEAEVQGRSNSEDASEFFKSYGFGLLGGIGLDAQVGEKTHLLLQGRYFLSLANQFDTDEADSKSGDFGFFVGLEFPLVPGGGGGDGLQ
jgi:hypothetical protein